MKKITKHEFLKQHSAILDKIEKFKKKINKEVYTPLHNKFVIENSPYFIGKVYEIEGKQGRRRSKLTRFVIYGLKVRILIGRFVTIEAVGWWLDENNNPALSDSRIIFGVGNPTKFILSKNQKNNKVQKHIIYGK